MKPDRDFEARARHLAGLLHKELGLGRGPLETSVARGRRRLPKPVRQDLLTVAEAARLSGHPRLAPQIDRKKADAAYRRALSHLRGPMMGEMRKTRLIGNMTVLAVNLALAFVMVVAILAWRDFI